MNDSASTPVRGIDVDEQSRCIHWHSPLDVVAMRFKCCNAYYACDDCHAALAGHASQRWSRGDEAEAVAMCGVCRSEMTMVAYLACDNRCPSCAAAFNPGCRKHRGRYFDLPTGSDYG